MGADMTAPRNPNAVVGQRLRGGAPNSHTRGVGIAKDSPSPGQFQERGTSDGSGP